MEVVTTLIPSGLNAANCKGPSRGKGGVRGWPVWASQTRAVPSQEAVKKDFPSGLNSANRIQLLCATVTVGTIQVCDSRRLAMLTRAAVLVGLVERIRDK